MTLSAYRGGAADTPLAQRESIILYRPYAVSRSVMSVIDETVFRGNIMNPCAP